MLYNFFKENLLKVFASVLTSLAVFTVNSACIMGLGQEVEPESLQRLKK